MFYLQLQIHVIRPFLVICDMKAYIFTQFSNKIPDDMECLFSSLRQGWGYTFWGPRGDWDLVPLNCSFSHLLKAIAYCQLSQSVVSFLSIIPC